MRKVRLGIRELTSRLSEHLRRVRAGETVIITDRGTQSAARQPVGRIVPMAQSLPERLEAMAQGGLILWSGSKLSPLAPVARTRGERTVAGLLVEDRR